MNNFNYLMNEIVEKMKLGTYSTEELNFIICNMLGINKTINLNLYRARIEEQFDITDSLQFTYNHNIEDIKKQRYNKKGEAVLYTSTNPLTAFEELKVNCHEKKVYIAVIHPVNKDVKFDCALNINENIVPDSNAGKYYREAQNIYAKDLDALHSFSTIGKLIEEDNDYSLSSEYASLLFQKFDSLMTVSSVSKGCELNVTFNKTAADEKLKLARVFECEIPENQQSLCFQVLRIGVCSGFKVEWYNWEIVQGSIRYHDTNICVMQNNPGIQLLYPNVTCKTLENDCHIGILNGKDVDFKIKLLKL